MFQSKFFEVQPLALLLQFQIKGNKWNLNTCWMKILSLTHHSSCISLCHSTFLKQPSGRPVKKQRRLLRKEDTNIHPVSCLCAPVLRAHIRNTKEAFIRCSVTLQLQRTCTMEKFSSDSSLLRERPTPAWHMFSAQTRSSHCNTLLTFHLLLSLAKTSLCFQGQSVKRILSTKKFIFFKNVYKK